MAGLADFRKQHPEYNDMSDNALGDALHAKFYSDMPKKQFDAKMGLGPTFGDALAAAPGGAINEIGKLPGMISGAAKFLYSDGTNGTLAGRLVDAAKAAPGAAMNAALAPMQYMRNLSPPEMRGSAPMLPGGEAENHPFLAMGAGDTAPIKQQIAEHPLALAGDAMMGMSATAPGRALLGRGADLAMTPVRAGTRAIADMVPARRAQNALLTAARATPGSDVQALADALQANHEPIPGVTLSAAQATQSPGIAQLEKGSRINPNQSPGWAQFDTGQNTGVFNAVNRVVSPATEEALNNARVARDAATRYDREGALALADQGSLEPGALTAPKVTPREPPLVPRESYGPHGERIIDIPDANARAPIKDTLTAAGQRGLEPDGLDRSGVFVAPVRDAMDRELNGPRGALPSVQHLINWLNKPGTLQAPGRAYEARKVISDALNAKVGVPLDELGASVKSAGVSSGALKGSIDTALDRASGGMWQQYLDSFRNASPDVNILQALSNIREDLARKIEDGAVDGNGNPKLSRAYLKQIIERHSTNKFGDVILPGPMGQLDTILNTAQQMEAPQLNYRMAATGGGGSDTASNLALSGAQHLAGALGGPMARTAITTMHGLGANRGATMLADLLQNPRNAAAALRTAADREAARRALRSSGITPAALAAALHALPAQQPQQ